MTHYLLCPCKAKTQLQGQIFFSDTTNWVRSHDRSCARNLPGSALSGAIPTQFDHCDDTFVRLWQGKNAGFNLYWIFWRIGSGSVAGSIRCVRACWPTEV